MFPIALALVVFVTRTAAAPENSTIIRCFSRGQLKSSPSAACPDGAVSHGRKCHEYMIVSVQDKEKPVRNDFFCLLPDNVNDILIAHANGTGCTILDHDTSAAKIWDGTVTCPPGLNYYRGKCILYKQIISGCYSYIRMQNLMREPDGSPVLPFSLRNPPEKRKECPLVFADIDCRKGREKQKEYTIFELMKGPQTDGSRFFLPAGLNAPVACSEFLSLPEHAPNGSVATCAAQGSRSAPCVISSSQWPRVLIPTVPRASDGSCPSGYCPRLCTCAFEGSEVEITKCAVAGLFDFPQKPKPAG